MQRSMSLKYLEWSKQHTQSTITMLGAQQSADVSSTDLHVCQCESSVPMVKCEGAAAADDEDDIRRVV